MANPKAVSVTTSATKLLDENTKRISFYMVNNSTTTTYIGADSTVTAANGIPIVSGGVMNEDQGFRLYKGPLYGIVSAGSADFRVWERESPI